MRPSGKRLQQAYELTLALIKPSLYASAPDTSRVLKAIKANGFEICRNKRLHWTPSEAEAFYAVHKDRFFYPRLVQAMSEPFMAMALGKANAVADWRKLIGPTHVYKAMWQQPDCLRAHFGISDTRNAFHGSGSAEEARQELNSVFEGFDCDWYISTKASRKRLGICL